MAEIHLFDFDGTLFRSPYEPVAWGDDWWNDPDSLNPPCVPEDPDQSWWNTPVVARARASIADPDVWSVLLTGRQERSGFRYRIPELLRQAGLRFDHVGLAPPSGTIAWKKKTLFQLVNKYSFIEKVQVWDDRPSHLREFERLAARMRVEIETHLVKTRAKAPECSEEELEKKEPSKPPVYLAVFLDSASRAALSHEFGYTHHNALADHMTIVTEVEPTDLNLVGTSVKMRVSGYYEDEKVQVVRVDPTPDLVRDRIPHITLSTAEGVKPALAATLVAESTPVHGPILSGVVDTFPRSLRNRTSSVPTSASRVASRHLQADEPLDRLFPQAGGRSLKFLADFLGVEGGTLRGKTLVETVWEDGVDLKVSKKEDLDFYYVTRHPSAYFEDPGGDEEHSVSASVPTELTVETLSSESWSSLERWFSRLGIDSVVLEELLADRKFNSLFTNLFEKGVKWALENQESQWLPEDYLSSELGNEIDVYGASVKVTKGFFTVNEIRNPKVDLRVSPKGYSVHVVATVLLSIDETKAQVKPSEPDFADDDDYRF